MQLLRALELLKEKDIIVKVLSSSTAIVGKLTLVEREFIKVDDNLVIPTVNIAIISEKPSKE